MATLNTTRLRLEPFSERHLDGLHAMDSSLEVMRYLGGQLLTREQTEASVARVQRCWAAWGTSWWSLLEVESNLVIGAGCIQYIRREATLPEDLDSLRVNPLEIGWRLHPDYWHQGFATEAARAMASYAFDRLNVSELLAVRHPENVDSERVMERLGMRFRGMEAWYGTIVAAHVITHQEWQRAQTIADGAQHHG